MKKEVEKDEHYMIVLSEPLLSRLKKHIKLCRRNLKSDKVKCCAECPFEDIIVKFYPEMRVLFIKKREILNEPK